MWKDPIYAVAVYFYSLKLFDLIYSRGAVSKDKKYICHTYNRFPVSIIRGKGTTGYDAEEKEYIDFTSGIGVNSLGFADQGWADAVSEQAHTLQHISNLYYSQPDVVTLAKGLGGGLPIGGILMSKKVEEVLGYGQHGSTFGGNPVACAGARYVLDKVLQPEFLDEVKKKAEYLRRKLLEIPQVVEVSGMGLMLGAELAEGYTAGEVAGRCAAEGLLVLTAKTRLRFLPPLTITYEEIDKGITVLKKVLDEK